MVLIKILPFIHGCLGAFYPDFKVLFVSGNKSVGYNYGQGFLGGLFWETWEGQGLGTLSSPCTVISQ